MTDCRANNPQKSLDQLISAGGWVTDLISDGSGTWTRISGRVRDGSHNPRSRHPTFRVGNYHTDEGKMDQAAQSKTVLHLHTHLQTVNFPTLRSPTASTSGSHEAAGSRRILDHENGQNYM